MGDSSTVNGYLHACKYCVLTVTWCSHENLQRRKAKAEWWSNYWHDFKSRKLAL
jgi:hypothetical protein